MSYGVFFLSEQNQELLEKIDAWQTRFLERCEKETSNICKRNEKIK